MQTGRVYTGIDKLIMAAMVDESASQHMMAFNNIHPGAVGVPLEAAYNRQLVCAPSNKSELELYRLLERANLLRYFETFLKFGGDDVRQLSEADEEEFIEIMGLVGMTQKPLHVRRLQKALVEWRADKRIEREQTGFRAGLCDDATSTIEGSLLHNSSASLSEASSMYQCCWTPAAVTMSHIDRQHQQQAQAEELGQCLAPREVIVGAPKRPRLMDNLHRRRASGLASHSSLKLGPTHDPAFVAAELRSSSPLAKRKSRSRSRSRSQSMCRSDSDESEDRLIEVIDNSQSDLELEDGAGSSSITTSTAANTVRLARGSPGSTGYSHNKYGRYKASLLKSPSRGANDDQA